MPGYVSETDTCITTSYVRDCVVHDTTSYRLTHIIVNSLEYKNKCLSFIAKLYICYCHKMGFTAILCAKFQPYLLLIYFIQ